MLINCMDRKRVTRKGEGGGGVMVGDIDIRWEVGT